MDKTIQQARAQVDSNTRRMAAVVKDSKIEGTGLGLAIVRRIVMNLLTNARDALNAKYPECDANKKITISTKEVSGVACRVLSGKPTSDIATPDTLSPLDGRRPRHWHPARPARTHLRTVLHDESARQGHGVGFFHQLRHR
ncbi:MAG: hypothetical protein ACOYOU_15535 [Kiritimatiellia bacterium]